METFPLTPQFVYKTEPTYKTIQTKFEAGYIQTRPVWVNPVRKWHLQWSAMTPAEAEKLRSFFREMKGASGAFWFNTGAGDKFPRPYSAPTLNQSYDVKTELQQVGYADTAFAQDLTKSGDLLFLADSGPYLKSFLVDSDGSLTLKDSADQGYARSVCVVGSHVFVGGTGGINTFSFDANGQLTYKHTYGLNSTDGDFYGLATDGTYLYSAELYDGVRSYSIGTDGQLTQVDSDTTITSVAQDVDIYGNYLYAAIGDQGIRSYELSSGNLTIVNTVDQGGYHVGVHVDGTYVFAAANTNGIHSFEITSSTDFASGVLSYVDSVGLPSTNTQFHAVWSDGSTLWAAAGDTGIGKYSLSSGNMNLITTKQNGGDSRCIIGDTSFVYAGAGYDGIRVFSELGARTRWASFTWADSSGNETQRSVMTDNLSVSANNVLTVSVPKFPPGVERAYIYVAKTTAENYHKQPTAITTSGGTWTESTDGFDESGASPPSSNNLSQTVKVHFADDSFELNQHSAEFYSAKIVLEELLS